MHHAYNMSGFFSEVNAPNQSDASLKKLYGQLGTTVESQLWYGKLKEVIDEFHPDIIWQDFNLQRVDENQRLKFLSYYYNDAVALNKEVVTTFRIGDLPNYSGREVVVTFQP